MSKKNENIIREKRTIEATKKNLMGPSGKFGMILQAFGTPITRQGSSLLDTGYMSNPYDDFVETEYASTLSGQQGPVAQRDEILTFDSDYVFDEGLLFDGMSRGIHLEILYWNAENRLKVSYKGYPVYIEVAGELEGYAPFEEWENIIERLARSAKDRIKQIKKQQEEDARKKMEERKNKFWEVLKMRWGV